ncbi:MAG: NUDIX domain-containing protein [Acidobacteria bacterium]|nr:NUDIX domain-containing protein [Acidobacteriota bacterium]
MASVWFRAGVVAVVRHPDLRRVMAFERVDPRGSWQLPQGGLQEGELPVEAVWRELLEETGLGRDHVELLAEFPDWVVYELPDAVRSVMASRRDRLGQAQKWFLFQASDEALEPTPDGREFVAWRWVEPEWLISHVPEWRADAYQRVLGTL